MQDVNKNIENKFLNEDQSTVNGGKVGRVSGAGANENDYEKKLKKNR